MFLGDEFEEKLLPIQLAMWVSYTAEKILC